MTKTDDWLPKGACYNTPTLLPIFFDARHEYAKAREICAGCPVAQQCLAAAIAEDSRATLNNHVFYGFRGGKTPRQRRKMVADFLRTTKAPTRGKWRRAYKPAKCHPEKAAYRADKCQVCYVKFLAERKVNA